MNKKITSFFIVLLSVFLFCSQYGYAQSRPATCKSTYPKQTCNAGGQGFGKWYCTSDSGCSCPTGFTFTGEWISSEMGTEKCNVGDCCPAGTIYMCGCEPQIYPCPSDYPFCCGGSCYQNPCGQESTGNGQRCSS